LCRTHSRLLGFDLVEPDVANAGPAEEREYYFKNNLIKSNDYNNYTNAHNACNMIFRTAKIALCKLEVAKCGTQTKTLFKSVALPLFLNWHAPCYLSSEKGGTKCKSFEKNHANAATIVSQHR